MNRLFRLSSAALLMTALAACGGSSGDDSPAPPAPPSTAERTAAATATANGNAACLPVLGPFYWEIGDAGGTQVSGAAGDGSVTAASSMRYYSASKWVYAAYVLQTRGVVALPGDAPYLNFTSGYSNFGVNPFLPMCQALTLGACLAARPGLDEKSADKVGVFDYDDGHMQQHASTIMGLGANNATALAASVQGAIGSFGFTYWTPEPGAGLQGTPSAYAGFLRALLGTRLVLGSTLANPAYAGYKVCTNYADGSCSKSARPGPDDSTRDSPSSQEDWSYFLGTWVEDDPSLGDHAYASVGGGGFYPWIDASRSSYGMVAREIGAADLEQGAGFHSAQCGRLIRQAWRTGRTVTSTVPTPAS